MIHTWPKRRTSKHAKNPTGPTLWNTGYNYLNQPSWLSVRLPTVAIPALEVVEYSLRRHENGIQVRCCMETRKNWKGNLLCDLNLSWNKPIKSLASKAFPVTNGCSRSSNVTPVNEDSAIDLRALVWCVARIELTNIRKYPTAPDSRPMDTKPSYHLVTFNFCSAASIAGLQWAQIPSKRFVADFERCLEFLELQFGAILSAHNSLPDDVTCKKNSLRVN